MTDWVPLLTAAVPGVVVGLGAFFQATRTAKIGAQTTRDVAAQNSAIEQAKVEVEQARVNAENVQLLRGVYEQMIADYRVELDRLHQSVERMQSNADKLSERLAKTSDENQDLKSQLFALQEQLREHKALILRQERLMEVRSQQVDVLKQQLAEAGLTPPASVEETV